MRVEKITEKILRYNNIIHSKITLNTAKPLGFYCELFYPSEDTSTPDIPKVFNNDNQKFIYSVVPDLKKTFVVNGLFGNTYNSSDTTFDNYSSEGEPYVLTELKFKIPVNTKILIYRDKEFHFSMKIFKHNVYPSHKGQMYIKNLITAFN